MAKYHLTNKAVDDLSEIWDYTYEVWSEIQADKYYFELIEDCKELSENQILGRNYIEIEKEIFNRDLKYVTNSNERSGYIIYQSNKRI